MADLAKFFLNSKSNIVQLELLELSHPNFSKVYRIVRNSVQGVTVNIDGQQSSFDYYPLSIKGGSMKDDLDQGITISFGDLGEVVPNEIDRIKQADAFNVKPRVRYWTFRSDDLQSPMYGPVVLEVSEFSNDQTGTTFEAKAPSINVSKTGEIYDLTRFPMLRGFL